MGYQEPQPDSDAAAIIAWAATLPKPTSHDHLLVTTNGNVIDLRPYLPPTQQKGLRHAHTTESFIDMVTNLGTARSYVFADRRGMRFGAVLDFGTLNDPTRDEYRIEYTPQQTPEWAAWGTAHGSQLEQVAFAEFIEENLETIVDPEGADLLEMIQDMRGHKNITFKSAQRLSDGQVQLAYEEDVETRGGSGLVTIPPNLVIECPVFHGEPARRFEAFLRYRIHDGGKLTFRVKLKRAGDIVPEALDAITAKVETGVGKVYAGWHV